MFAEKPIIGVRGGATIELVTDGFNGLLYASGDYEDLARKILYIYQNPNLAQRMGENGREWAVRYFSRQRYGKELKKMLLSTMHDG
jgi:glycosyltransferase involved in cell wall biosynthesis